MTDYSPEAVEAILGAFNDRVLQAIQDEDRVDDIVLRDHLREAIAKTVEDPDSPWSDVGRTSPIPVAMMVYDEHGEPVFDTTGMPYSKAKAKAFGKGPRAVIWPPYQGTRMDPVVRSNLMIAHWAAFANRLLRKYARKYMFKFWRIEKRRRAIIMHENMARRTLILNMDLLGQLTFMSVPVILMMSQLFQWLAHQVMPQLRLLDCLDNQLQGLIEPWMFSMHQVPRGKNSRPTSIPGTLVLET